MKLIDKAAVRQAKEAARNAFNSLPFEVRNKLANGYERLLEVEMLLSKGFAPWLTPDHARRAAEIAREETIKEVCEWIKYNNENGGCSFDGWENDLKKYLEGEL